VSRRIINTSGAAIQIAETGDSNPARSLTELDGEGSAKGPVASPPIATKGADVAALLKSATRGNATG
jgi:hypothetical protein